MNYSDIEQVADLALLMYEESPYTLEVSREQFLRTLNSGVEVIVHREDEKIVGFVLGMIGNAHPIWGDVKYAAELAWYVHPAYRGKGAAIQLLNEFEAWAAVNDCKFIVCAGMHNNSFDQVKSMYEKRGYTQAEVAFIRELK